MSDWQPENAEDIAQQIKTLESAPSASENNDIKSTDSDIKAAQSFLNESIPLLSPELLPEIEKIVESYARVGKKVRAHGDLSVKNVLIGKNKIWSPSYGEINKYWSPIGGTQKKNWRYARVKIFILSPPIFDTDLRRCQRALIHLSLQFYMSVNVLRYRK